jgi:hypothetical protein
MVSFLGRLRVRIKLVLPVGVSLAGMVAMVAIDTVSTHRHLIEVRVDKLQSVVDATVSVGEALQHQVDAKTMTRDEEMARLRDLIHGLRYDQGNGYVVMESLDADMLIHGGHPEFEGHPESALMGNGQPLSAVPAAPQPAGPTASPASARHFNVGSRPLSPRVVLCAPRRRRSPRPTLYKRHSKARRKNCSSWSSASRSRRARRSRRNWQRR